MRHGVGKLFYRNGDIFEGEFRNNLSEGFCTYRYKNGDKFSAVYSQGYPSNHTVHIELSSGETMETN